MALNRRGAPRSMTAGAYEIVAGIVRSLPDGPLTRQDVANHFATEFNKRSASFDPYSWGQRTGGKVAPNSANMGGHKPPLAKAS